MFKVKGVSIKIGDAAVTSPKPQVLKQQIYLCPCYLCAFGRLARALLLITSHLVWDIAGGSTRVGAGRKCDATHTDLKFRTHVIHATWVHILLAKKGKGPRLSSTEQGSTDVLCAKRRERTKYMSNYRARDDGT